MQFNRALLFLVTLALVSPASFACSFGAGYTIAQPPVTSHRGEGGPPSAPTINLVSLKRGFDDGNGGSCSDAGVLELEVGGFDPSETWGLRLELVEGGFPESVFPEEYVLPIQENGRYTLRFVWLDLPHGQRQTSPIGATIAVWQISGNGLESEPTFIEVMHPGGGA